MIHDCPGHNRPDTYTVFLDGEVWDKTEEFNVGLSTGTYAVQVVDEGGIVPIFLRLNSLNLPDSVSQI
jgi:hypothetical protein